MGAKKQNPTAALSTRLFSSRRFVIHSPATGYRLSLLPRLLVRLLALLALALALTTASQTYAQAEPTPAQLNLALSAAYLEDASGMLTLDEVVALRAQGAFKPNLREQIHFGMTRSAYWIHFSPPWATVGPHASRILEVGPPKLVPGRVRGGIDLYTLGANK